MFIKRCSLYQISSFIILKTVYLLNISSFYFFQLVIYSWKFFKSFRVTWLGLLVTRFLLDCLYFYFFSHFYTRGILLNTLRTNHQRKFCVASRGSNPLPSSCEAHKQQWFWTIVLIVHSMSIKPIIKNMPNK